MTQFFDLSNDLLPKEENNVTVTASAIQSEENNLEEESIQTVQTNNNEETKGNVQSISLESKSSKIRKWAIYIYAGLMTAMSIYLIIFQRK